MSKISVAKVMKDEEQKSDGNPVRSQMRTDGMNISRLIFRGKENVTCDKFLALIWITD